MKINILGITLARAGSKSIKNKNITLINRKPLIYYTIKEAKKSKYIMSHKNTKVSVDTLNRNNRNLKNLGATKFVNWNSKRRFRAL